MQVITGYIQYAFGLPPTQDAIVTNEGLGWDSLLKMEQSSWWVFTGWGVVPKHARTGWRIFFPIWLLKCLSTFWTCDASTFAPSCRLSHSSPRDNYRKLHFSSVPQQGTKKRECSNVICVVLCTFPVTKLLRETQRSVVPTKKPQSCADFYYLQQNSRTPRWFPNLNNNTFNQTSMFRPFLKGGPPRF